MAGGPLANGTGHSPRRWQASILNWNPEVPRPHTHARRPAADDAYAVLASSFVRGIRRRCRLAVPGQTRDPVILVPDVAGPGRRHRAKEIGRASCRERV